MNTLIKTMLLALGLLWGGTAHAQVLNVLTCTVANTETQEAPGANCTYGGIKRTCTTVGLTTTNTYFCFPGNTGPQGPAGAAGAAGVPGGQLYNASGVAAAGLKSGRYRVLDSDGATQVAEGLAWSSADNAYWPFDPATGATWPRVGALWYTNGFCSGSAMLVFTAENVVITTASGTYAPNGSISHPSSCWFDNGGTCQMEICPDNLAVAGAATHPPSLSSGAPYRLAN